MAMAQPFVDATGGTTTHLVYQDMTYHYWYLAFTGTWSAAPQAVGPSGNQSYGPVAATIAARGADATAAFTDGQQPLINDAAASDRSAGAWQARVDIAEPEGFTVIPVIIPLNAGPELMMIFVQQGGQMQFATRTAGTWSSATSLMNCLTNDRPALAPLPNGGAILAFRGQDKNLYWSLYAGGAWSAVAPFATPNVSVDTSPSVTHGIGSDTAELAYVNGGVAYHARLSGGAWSVLVTVGGTSLNGVAIAAVP
jgi:hypothetical protein